MADLIDDDKNKENNLENRSYNFAINLYRPGDSVTIQYISEVNSFDDKCEWIDLIFSMNILSISKISIN